MPSFKECELKDDLYELLSSDDSKPLQKAVKNYASKNGLIYIKDTSGTNINVQIIDTDKINFDNIFKGKPNL